MVPVLLVDIFSSLSLKDLYHQFCIYTQQSDGFFMRFGDTFFKEIKKSVRKALKITGTKIFILITINVFVCVPVTRLHLKVTKPSNNIIHNSVR